MVTQEFAAKLMAGKVKFHAPTIDEMSPIERRIHFARTKHEEADRAHYGEW